MDKNSKKSNNILGSFVAGAVAGVLGGLAAGFMLANKPGRELRKDIQYSSSEFMRNLRDRVGEITSRAASKLEELRDFTDEKFRASAINIQEQVAVLGRQLDELTHRQESNVKEEAR